MTGFNDATSQGLVVDACLNQKVGCHQKSIVWNQVWLLQRSVANFCASCHILNFRHHSAIRLESDEATITAERERDIVQPESDRATNGGHGSRQRNRFRDCQAICGTWSDRS